MSCISGCLGTQVPQRLVARMIFLASPLGQMVTLPITYHNHDHVVGHHHAAVVLVDKSWQHTELPHGDLTCHLSPSTIITMS
jgi:hypothetical protein